MTAAVLWCVAGSLLLSLVLEKEIPIESVPPDSLLLKQRVKSSETGKQEELVRLSLEGPAEVSWLDKLDSGSYWAL